MAVLPIAAPADLPPAIPLELDRTTDATENPNALLEGDAIEAPKIGSTHLVGDGGRGPEGQLWQYCHSVDEGQRGTESMAVLP